MTVHPHNACHIWHRTHLGEVGYAHPAIAHKHLIAIWLGSHDRLGNSRIVHEKHVHIFGYREWRFGVAIGKSKIYLGDKLNNTKEVFWQARLLAYLTQGSLGSGFAWLYMPLGQSPYAFSFAIFS
jgi:hypothetical protein